MFGIRLSGSIRLESTEISQKGKFMRDVHFYTQKAFLFQKQNKKTK